MAESRAEPGSTALGDPSRLRFSILFVVTLAVGGLVSIAILSVLLVQILAARTSTLELLSGVAGLLTQAIESGVNTHLGAARNQVEFVARRIEDDPGATVDDSPLAEFLAGALAAAPQIESVGFVDVRLRQVVAARDNSGRPRLERNDLTGVPLARDAIDRIRSTASTVWAEPVFARGKTYLNVRRAVRRGDEFAGMVFAVVSVQELSLLMTDIGALYRGTAFVLYGAERVIAHPNLASPHPAQSAASPTVSLAALGDPLLPLLANASPLRAFGGAERLGIEVRRVETPDGAYYAIMRRSDAFGAVPLTVGFWLKVEGELAALKRLQVAAAIGFAVMLVAIVIAVLVGRVLSHPVRRLAAASRQVQEFELTRMVPLPRSRVREIDDQAIAFNAMVGGLAAFERYVPKRLVQSLIKLGLAGDVASEERRVTLMFTDIVGFTALAERLPPARVAALLNHHFTLLSECVEAEGGTIDKFIGDAIMAFWGAPDPQHDHALRACRAAQRIARRLADDNAESSRDGGPPLRIRIGIHSGAVLVGNIGSQSRTSYTVIGDTVNTCQRIEALGKRFDRGDPATILVGDPTVAMLGDAMGCEPVGMVELRGRQAPVRLYRLEVEVR